MARKEKFNVGDNINWAQTIGKAPEQEEVQPIPDSSFALNKKESGVPVSDNRELEVKPVPASIEKEFTVSKSTEEVVSFENDANITTSIAAPISFTKKKKETRSVHKNFLITRTLDEKLSKLAAKLDVSQNDLINDILTQVFNSIDT